MSAVQNDEHRPIVLQQDLTILLDTTHSAFEQVREQLSRFSELVKSPGRFHTYRMTPLTLWNAAAAGVKPAVILQFLQQYSQFEVPKDISEQIIRFVHRFGLIRMQQSKQQLQLICTESGLADQLLHMQCLQPYELKKVDAYTLELEAKHRGNMKQQLTHLGYPVEDKAGYQKGEALRIELKPQLDSARPFTLRDYQLAALDAFYRTGTDHDQEGSGVLVLPCGSGKTIIGIAAMARLGCATLILTSNATSVHQWKQEIIHKTSISSQFIGEYTGARKQVCPITIATYQILTHRKNSHSEFKHMQLFHQRNWGLIIYDEVHLLPAPVFRATASIQATRRLGLTATLVREDQREEDVFSLVGPKRYEAPWKMLEREGWIAPVQCVEIRVPLPHHESIRYAGAPARLKHRIAAENLNKLPAVKMLLQLHSELPTLIIGQYIEQLQHLAEQLGIPLIHGKVRNEERERMYRAFRSGKITRLIVSKVANFAVDLPDAALAIQISGSFGSRQEEAQRLGRILRPNRLGGSSYFYSLVSEHTKEQEFSMKRQLFLVQQGYRYDLRGVDSLEALGGGQHEK